MTALAAVQTESLFHSPRGLYEFQAQDVVRCVLRPTNLLCWDTGLGKSIGALAGAALLFEDNAIDHVLLVCEQAKIREWVEDAATFTDLSAIAYVGTPERRRRIREGTSGRRKKGQAPDRLQQIIIGSFETLKADLVTPHPQDKRVLQHGPLLELLADKRVLVVYDETAKLANRQSATHKAHKYAVEHWRENGLLRLLALTATPMERNPSSYYNLGRIICPETMPTVNDFHKLYVSRVGFNGEPTHFRNLNDFAIRFRHILLRKRKTDDDVRDQFPKLTEEFRYVEMTPEHRAFYDRVVEALDALDDPEIEQGSFNSLRQLAGYPLSILHSEGQLSRAIVATLGQEGLDKLGCVKRERLISDLLPIVGQGERAIVFSTFPTILDPLSEDLKGAGIRSAKYHGGLSRSQREASKTRFKEGEVDVLLCSASGERGINLPEASYVINFDLPSKHSSYLQRLNRASRIGAREGGILTVKSYIVEGSVEEGLAGLWLGRNSQQDTLIDADVPDDDDTFVSADVRARLLRAARKA